MFLRETRGDALWLLGYSSVCGVKPRAAGSGALGTGGPRQSGDVRAPRHSQFLMVPGDRVVMLSLLPSI